MDTFEVSKPRYGNGQEFTPLLDPSESRTGREGQPAIGFVSDAERPRRDVRWAHAHGAMLLLTVIGGLTALIAKPKDAWVLASTSAVAGPNQCPMNAPTGRRTLLQDDQDMGASTKPHHYGALALALLVGCLGTGWLFVLGFRYHAKIMVRAALGATLFIPFSGALACLGDHDMTGVAIWLVVTGVLAWVFWTWRRQIDLVGRLLGVAGEALAATPQLIGLSVGLQVSHWLAVLTPAYVFAMSAFLNGSLVVNSERKAVVTDVASDQGVLFESCEDGMGHVVNCCQWQMDTWAYVYLGLLGLTVLWSTLLLSQINVYTVAGAVAQWYFAATPDLTLSSSVPDSPGPAKPPALPAGRVMRSLRHALGPSLGSLCIGAAVLGLVSILRGMINVLSRNRMSACVFFPVTYLLRLLLRLVEFMTRFTTVRMALTGEGFMVAAHGTADLLKRNALDSLGMWWLPSLILRGCTIMIAFLYAWILVWVAELMLDDGGQFMMMWVGWYLAVIILNFYSNLLLNIVDTVFVCYAMDRDAACITRQDVHDVLKDVPGAHGPVIEQPDGGLAYGAPTDANTRVANNV